MKPSCCPQPSVVLRVDPASRRRRRIGMAAALLAVLASSFAGGRWLGSVAECVGPNAQRRLAEQELVSSRAQVEALEQQVVNARLGAEVDRQVVEQLRQDMKDQQQTASNLREQVAIYKGLMMKSGGAELGIRSWTVSSEASEGGRRFHYRLVLQQLADQRGEIVGDVVVAIAGVDTKGRERVLPLRELSMQHHQGNIELSFTYFQIVEGELDLPADFSPQRVQVLARANRPRNLQVEKRFAWEVQGDGTHVGEGKG
jgi:hypothetical protein